MIKDVDISTFQEDIGLDYSSLKELYLVFVDEIKQEMEAVNRYFSLREFQEIGKLVHNIKGIASSYRAFYVFESAKSLESKMKSQDFENINSYVLDLNEVVDEAIREINKYFEGEALT